MRTATALAVGVAVSLVFGVVVFAYVPQLINYQGILLDSEGGPITTPVNVVFAIWDAGIDGDSLWSEQQVVSPDASGRFSVLLGAVSPVPDSAFAGNAYLSIKVESDNELSPRTRLVTVPYAYVTSQADSSEHCQICDTCLNCEGDGDWIIDGENIYHPPGLVAVGSQEPLAKFDVNVPTDETHDPLNIRYHGTTRMIVKDFGEVGIGTNDPLHRLDVRGDASFDEYLFHNFDDDTYLRFSTDQFDIGTGSIRMLTSAGGAQYRVVVNEDGTDVDFRVESATDPSALFVRGSDSYVGLGTDEPVHRLDVRGDAGFDSVLSHNDDPDTYIQFTPDQIDLSSGGLRMLTAAEGFLDQVVVNEDGASVDFRVESGTETSALHVRGTDGNVGIGTSSPAEVLDVDGDIAIRGGDLKDAAGMKRLSYSSGGRLDLNDEDGNAILTVGTNGNVGIGITSGARLLDVNGEAIVRDDLGVVGAATIADTLFVGSRARVTSDLTVGGRINQAVFRSGAATSAGPNLAVDMSGGDLDQGELHFGNTVDNEWVDMWFVYSNGHLMGHYLQGDPLTGGVKMYRFNLTASGVIAYAKGGAAGMSAGYAYWDATSHDVAIYEDAAGNGACEWWSYDRQD